MRAAIHEIGHARGLFSHADVVDVNSAPAVQGRRFTGTLDLFRYSALSLASQVNDTTADTATSSQPTDEA